MPLASQESSRVIVCHCQAVSERAIRAAVRSGARCLRSVARSCAAGRSCGGCTLAIDQILRSELEQLDDAPPALPDLAAAS
jgi:assimilatory nitrate reductase catalytic subunit/bacterioferritin-associated ferredoxin